MPAILPYRCQMISICVSSRRVFAHRWVIFFNTLLVRIFTVSDSF